MASRILTIFVDCQNDFLKPGGALYINRAEAIIPDLVHLNKYARKQEYILYTQDWHKIDDPEFDNFGKHCVEYTGGANIIKELACWDASVHKFNDPLKIECINHPTCLIQKNTVHAFDSMATYDFIDIIDPQLIVVAGVATEYCVDSIICSLINMDKGESIIVPTDTIFAIDEYEASKRMIYWLDCGVTLSSLRLVLDRIYI